MATPKARLFQIYPQGKGITFVTESVLTSPNEGDGVPGSTSYFQPNHAVTFRCTLSLPDGSQVVSDLFQRKKDAEHDASQRALQQMSVSLARSPEGQTMDEKWENLRRRIVDTFSDKNVLSYLPLREHFRMSVKREGTRYGQVPIAVLATLDAKINTLCKAINRKSETDPVYSMALLCKAASSCSSVKLDSENLCISRVEPFKSEVEQELLLRKKEDNKQCIESNGQMDKDDELCFIAVQIPASAGDTAFSSQIVVQSEDYYLDALAQKIGLQDGCRLVMSRPIVKTHPATRLYWAVPKNLPKAQGPKSDFVELMGKDTENSLVDHYDQPWYSVNQQEGLPDDSTKNVRASLLMGYPVYGDVILAAVGGDWRSGKAYSCDVSLSYYFRLLLGRFPQGNYKLSRGAVLVSNLPLLFSSRSQWRGMSPRGLLIEFCQQHRLPEPVFVLSYPGNVSPGAGEVDGKIPGLAEVTDLDDARATKLGEIENHEVSESVGAKNEDDNLPTALHGGPFTCTVRVEWQKGSPIEYESGGPHRNRHDAIHSCALKALHKCRPWFEICLRGSFEPIIPDNAGDWDADLLNVEHAQVFVAGTGCCWETCDQELFDDHSGVDSSQIDLVPPSGAMVTICYTIRWFRDADHNAKSPNVLLEKKEEFTFELGSSAVLVELDAVVAEMPVGQTSCFFTSAPPLVLLYAATDDIADEDRFLNTVPGNIKFTVQLLKYVEPPEERMEAALFKPSLSKQRLGCALSIIQKLQAKSLIDLGCGSGSLLENLLEEPTGLVELVGVDISPKSLVRAAKLLSTKLREDQPGKEKLDSIKLYEGSIADFNPQLLGIDVAVCIEVVEHMDPEPLRKFGSTVLGKLQPRVLIVSTPNFEYNPILQGLEWDPCTNSLRNVEKAIDNNVDNRMHTGSDSDLALGSMEKRIRLSDGKDEGNGSTKSRPAQQVKFRNEDHRFEWTRAEFRDWAMTMANDYDYDVTFDGVGGTGEDDGPGYASQIAIFTRQAASPVQLHDNGGSKEVEELVEIPTMKIVWQWTPVEQQDV